MTQVSALFTALQRLARRVYEHAGREDGHISPRLRPHLQVSRLLCSITNKVSPHGTFETWRRRWTHLHVSTAAVSAVAMRLEVGPYDVEYPTHGIIRSRSLLACNGYSFSETESPRGRAQLISIVSSFHNRYCGKTLV